MQQLSVSLIDVHSQLSSDQTTLTHVEVRCPEVAELLQLYARQHPYLSSGSRAGEMSVGQSALGALEEEMIRLRLTNRTLRESLSESQAEMRACARREVKLQQRIDGLVSQPIYFTSLTDGR